MNSTTQSRKKCIKDLMIYGSEPPTRKRPVKMPGIGLRATASIGSSIVDPVTFSYGSGSTDPYQWLTKPALFVSDQDANKNNFFQQFFCLLLFDIVVDPGSLCFWISRIRILTLISTFTKILYDFLSYVNAFSKSNKKCCGAGVEELKLNCLLEPELK
jgi:hypothetical protein